MGFEIDSWKDVACGWKAAAKPCQMCSSAAAAIFCQVDSAFLCLDCDSKIHDNNKRHHRVWMCEVCEQAPAGFFCKADAATLCVTCDHDIHNANPLARRHDRTPVQPFVDSAASAVKSYPLGLLVPTSNVGNPPDDHELSSSWLLPNTNLCSKFNLEEYDMKSADLFSTEIDPFSDLEYQNSFHQQLYSSAAMDSVVPAQMTDKTVPDPVSNISIMNNENCFDIDFCRSKITALIHPHQPISQSVSSSSLDVGLVPEGNFSDDSFPFGQRDPSGAVSGNTASQTSQLSGGFDREARVLRYREKRKNRKFEKTIRYASRKAYAESRPRIKGRFAKRTEMESEIKDGIFSSDQVAAMAFLADSYYGVVPTF